MLELGQITKLGPILLASATAMVFYSCWSDCAEYNLAITNTIFRLANKYKTSWTHPRSKHWNLIDYILIRQKGIND